MSTALKGFFKEVAEENGWGEERDEQTRVEIARTMIEDGESNEKIIRYTRLTMLEIERLRANIY